jgi:hypothetical protein
MTSRVVPSTGNHQRPAQPQASATTKAMDWLRARREGRRLPQHTLPSDLEEEIAIHNFNREHGL